MQLNEVQGQRETTRTSEALYLKRAGPQLQALLDELIQRNADLRSCESLLFSKRGDGKGAGDHLLSDCTREKMCQDF